MEPPQSINAGRTAWTPLRLTNASLRFCRRWLAVPVPSSRCALHARAGLCLIAVFLIVFGNQRRPNCVDALATDKRFSSLLSQVVWFRVTFVMDAPAIVDERALVVAPGTPMAYNVEPVTDAPSLVLQASVGSFLHKLLCDLPQLWVNLPSRLILLTTAQAVIASFARVAPDFVPPLGSFMAVFVSVSALERLDGALLSALGSLVAASSLDDALRKVRARCEASLPVWLLGQGDFSLNQSVAAPDNWLETYATFDAITLGGASLRIFTEFHSACGGFGRPVDRAPFTNASLFSIMEAVSGLLLPPSYLGISTVASRRRGAGAGVSRYLSNTLPYSIRRYLSNTLPYSIRRAISSPRSFLEECHAAIAYANKDTKGEVVSQRLDGLLPALPLLSRLMLGVEVSSRLDTLELTNVAALPVIESRLGLVSFAIPSSIEDRGEVIAALGTAIRTLDPKGRTPLRRLRTLRFRGCWSPLERLAVTLLSNKSMAPRLCSWRLRSRRSLNTLTSRSCGWLSSLVSRSFQPSSWADSRLPQTRFGLSSDFKMLPLLSLFS